MQRVKQSYSQVKLRRLRCENFTVFSIADLDVSPDLNVFVGENGTGKTHVLKLVYSILAVSTQEGRKPSPSAPTKAVLQTRIAEKLSNVFRPQSLGHLTGRRPGRPRCDVSFSFSHTELDVDFKFATNSKSEVAIGTAPCAWLASPAIFFPTRELLTIYPNFVATYESHYLEFEETWRDTCLLLGAPLRRGARGKPIRALLDPLEETMNGEIQLDKSGRFYLKSPEGLIEMPLVAEGIRKLGMIAQLIANGTLLHNGYLFWDEPEANLNPKIVALVARTIFDLCRNGIQVFIATHSLFLLREFEILLASGDYPKLSPRFFGFLASEDGVHVEQGSSVDEIGPITSLDEELRQSDRFLSLETA